MNRTKQALHMGRQSFKGRICPGHCVQQPIALRILAKVQAVTKEISFINVFKSHLPRFKIHKLLLKANLEGVHSFIGLATHIPIKGVSELMPLQRLI